ncbi:hypothetical protein Rumeso_00080 [Rubellimicrobium mesophilum DSM 19309]|uniref:ZIP Zinc transporter n=1 Tax=Rubellimicrobium mesophilum DSM 19309 TaxID=442562 RepID=A0A017HV31_9RHOB|nr:hypothetical protein [Rubellimicrobium mesophilum]EYD78251.1 hypothetical protein Rumeso_00080 [Rubellimicrobium mesophilum DSM 19309]
MSPLVIAALVALLALVLVHVVTPYLRFLEGTPRSIWLSVAGGVSVAYVFVHFMPELAESRETVAKAAGELGLADRHVFLIALAGLLTFYGLHRLAQTSRSRREGEPVQGGRGSEGRAEASTSPRVFWIHMASFSVYNALVGYLLFHREVMTLRSLAFFATAMALHFVVTDYGLNEDDKEPYRRIGRWVLVAAVVAGWLLGLLTDVPEAAVAVLTAFLGGGVVLNVLKEEVPSERQSRFWAFAGGAAAYSALLLAL